MYKVIQLEAEQRFTKYLQSEPLGVKNIVIVGACEGREIRRLLRTYRNAKIHAFEPSPRYFGNLVKMYKKSTRVFSYNIAIAHTDGKKSFFEGSLPGTGSILPLSNFSKSTYGITETEKFTVDSKSLDSFFNSNNPQIEIDLLWIDVQGAEIQVLNGALETLKHTKCVFIEVSNLFPLATGGALADEIQDILSTKGFFLVGLGLDSSNLTGNALYAKKNQVKHSEMLG